MADEPISRAELEAALPVGVRSGPFADPEQQRAAQEKSVLSHRANRAKAQQVERERREGVVEEIVAAAEGAIESDRLAGKTNEELADLVVYRYAKIVLLGGPAFMPSSLKEATDAAKSWSRIAVDEAARRRGASKVEPGGNPVEDAAEKLRGLREVAAGRARQRLIDTAG
jgi:hypothetical protein